jgi:RNA polymerase sigma-70 factor (ECF subfamily)
VDDLTTLALAAAGGDRFALGAFVRQSQPDVWRLCAHLVDRQAADDLTQEVYLRALPALGSFRADSSARTWLLVIARRTCMDTLRRRTRQRRLRDRLQREYRSSAAPDGDPSSGLPVAELIAGLAEDRREAFVLTQLLGLPYAEAAEVCGVPIGTIRSRIARARSDLLAALAGAEDAGRTDTGR